MSKKMVFRLPRIVRDDDSDRDIVMNKLEIFYVDSDKGFQGNKFSVSAEDLGSNGFKEVGKDRLAVFDAVFIDNYKRIKRYAQVITLKDIGSIIGYAGLNSDSVVLEAGSGSGGFSCFVANFVKSVDSFDINEKHQEVARKNAKALDIDNINFEIRDVYDENKFPENDYDLFLLDVPEPSRALGSASRVLRVGGFLVVYAPHISQIQDVVKALPENLVVDRVVENMERQWTVSERKLRPETKDFGHTAFLAFIRKIY